MSFWEGLGRMLAQDALKASAKRIRRQFTGGPEREALGRCYQAGLEALFAHITFPEATEQATVQDYFIGFVRDEAVSEELESLLSGYPPDLSVLSVRFRATGYAHPLALEPGFKAFVEAFVRSADAEEILRSRIIVGEIRRIHERLTDQEQAAKYRFEALMRALVDAQSVEEQRAGKAYLTHLHTTCQWLPLATFGAEADAEGDVRLSDVYQTLDTTRYRVQTKDGPIEVEASDKDPQLHHAYPDTEKQPIAAAEAVAQERYLVVLGDPGSGKSTFVRAMVLEAMQRQDAEPDAELVLPVLLDVQTLAAHLTVPATNDPQARTKALALQLIDEAVRTLPDAGAQAFGPAMRRALGQGRCFLVVDGLDEVVMTQRALVRDAVRAYVRLHQPAHVIVTCRVRSYVEEVRLAGFAAYTLAPLRSDHIEAFARRWYTAQVRTGRFSKEDAEALGDDLAAAVQRDAALLKLARTPILLTTMALVHQSGERLPDKRALLYKEAIEVLLLKWKRSAVEAGLFAELVPLLNDEQQLVRSMEVLAYEAHCAGGADEDNPAVLTRGDACRVLEASGYMPYHVAVRFLEFVDRRAGLLVGGGGETDLVYRFPHRTFQEFLAGRYLFKSTSPSPATIIRAVAARGASWAEAVQLGAEDLLYTTEAIGHASLGRDKLRDLIVLLSGGPVADAGGQRALLWTARMADLYGADALWAEVASDYPELPDALRHKLVAVLRGVLPTPERVQAGNLLARLGDPREAVSRPEATAFVSVRPGPFIMGAGTGDFGEHTCEALTYPYWIARYPVTVAQFRAFCEEQPFTLADADALKGGANHPVVWVSWHEAQAYAAWLTQRLRTLAPSRLEAALSATDVPLWKGLLAGTLRVALPSEAEWERAARGTDGTTYPWGDEQPSPEHANYAETNVGTRSPVGCFPQGATPDGVEELAGNVWEWTRSLWGKSWSEADFPYPYQIDEREEETAPDTIRRVLRGGAFLDSTNLLRGAARLRSAPNSRGLNGGFRVVVRPK